MLRSGLPFRRIAVVLSGGGALGAYEVGVLRVLESLRLRPAILAGTSAGAINAVLWRAHDFQTAILERTWRDLRSESVGMRWATLGLRGGGLLVAAYAVIQVTLTLLGSPEIAVMRRFWRPGERGELLSTLLDCAAWMAIGAAGALAAGMSRRVEAWLAAIHRPGDPGRVRRWLRRALITLAVVHLVMWGLGLPWPHRFSATVLAAGAAAWLASRPGRPRDTMRRLLTWLLPETRGRGLWGGVARRRLLEDLVASGDPARLVSGDTLLIVSALALDSGRIVHFAAGPRPGPAFEAGVDETLTEVVWMGDPGQVLEAAVASSAIPLAFEPVRIAGREFVDAGQFSNQPLDAAVAAGADAILVVLTAPSGGTGVRRRESNLVELSARLLEVASWRQLNLQLAGHGAESLRAGRAGAPAVVVVEPVAPLPGGLLAFDAGLADELMRRGEEDARRALAHAGWIEPAPA